MIHYPPPIHPDPFIAYICLFMVLVTGIVFILVYDRDEPSKSSSVSYATSTIDNIQTRAASIAISILKIDSESKLADTLGLIKRYELDYPEDANAQNEVFALNKLYDWKKQDLIAKNFLRFKGKGLTGEGARPAGSF